MIFECRYLIGYVFSVLMVAVLAPPIHDRITLEGQPEKLVPIAEAVPLPPVDERPLVIMHSMDNCVPCGQATVFFENNKDFPLRIEVRKYKHNRDMPDFVLQRGVPLFHFKGESGGWHTSSGWNGPDKLIADYKAVNKSYGLAPAPLAVKMATGENPVELFSKFMGAGRFSIQPDKPVAAYIDDSTFLQYTKLVGSVKIVNKQPVVTLEQPFPRVAVKKFGLWVKADILGADGQLPAAMMMNTSMGQYRIEVKGVK